MTGSRVKSDPVDPLATHPDDMAFWLFSGGSTGWPKGVVHLHARHRRTRCETYAAPSAGDQPRATSRSPRPSSTTPTGSGNNLTFPYWVGATTVLRPGRPTRDRLLETAASHRPSLFFSVPTLYGAMVNLPGTR